MLFDGQSGKTEYYALYIEFQERDSPYVNSFIWIFNTKYSRKKMKIHWKYTECTVPGPHNERDLFEFVKMYYNFGRNILEL